MRRQRFGEFRIADFELRNETDGGSSRDWAVNRSLQRGLTRRVANLLLMMMRSGSSASVGLVWSARLVGSRSLALPCPLACKRISILIGVGT